MSLPKKSLGQHWLTDEKTLNHNVDSAELSAGDTVLEVGPGTGSLTERLLSRGVRVIAVEKDEALVAKLPKHPKLQVIAEDILIFDLTKLPPDYKVVANIPYYLTSNLLRVLTESSNPPASMTLLVQKEVAQRICAKPGQMSILSVSVQLYYECAFGQMVPAKLFIPPPKIDSQVVFLKRRQPPLFEELDSKNFFQVVKAGFAGRRKKLRSSLAAGLHLPKDQADDLLRRAGIDGGLRAQNLSLSDWHRLYQAFEN